MSRNTSTIILVATLALFACVSAAPSCLDPTGQKVDWFVAFKLPGGTTYAYCDAVSCDSLSSTKRQLNTFSDSPVLRTLEQIQNVADDQVGSLFWNDQPPNMKASLTVAHAKGFMGFTQKSGFLMVHSTPLFPEVEDDTVKLNINDGQTKFGQHFFCVSTSTSELESIAAAYNIDWPKVYAGKVPSSFTNVVALKKMLNNERNTSIMSAAYTFESLIGKQFVKLSKSGKWLVPFYENVASKHIGAGLLVESWGSPQEDSNCDNYPVMSNLVVQIGDEQYKYTKDHSKYAISIDASKPFVCFGDINRQESQWKRGGGTVCFLENRLYSLMRSAMLVSQSCYA